MFLTCPHGRHCTSAMYYHVYTDEAENLSTATRSRTGGSSVTSFQLVGPVGCKVFKLSEFITEVHLKGGRN